MVGDGSFLQTGTELATAVMLGTPLVVVVLNNGGWEAIKDLQINLFGADRARPSPTGAPLTESRTSPTLPSSPGHWAALRERVEDPDEARGRRRTRLRH